MSDRPAAMDGCYSDFRIVKTRSVAQLIVEIPIERAAEAVALFGVPQPGQEIHVAVARLNNAVPAPARSTASACSDPGPLTTGSETGRERTEIPAPTSPPPGERSASGLGGRTTGAEPGREARPWNTIPRAQQAGIKCGDPGFQKWLDTLDTPCDVIEFANALWPKDPNRAYGVRVCHHCEVSSRREFSRDLAAGDRWDRFLARYDEQANRTAEQRG